VQLLLADNRVDPSVQDQLPIQFASQSGHVEVVKLLLADKRVDPSANNQCPIRVACKCNRIEVVKLLLSDQRVDISELPEPSYPLVSSLCLLRRSLRNRVRLQRNETSASHKQQDLGTQDRLLSSVITDIEKIASWRTALLNAHLLSDLSSLCLDYVPDLFCYFDGQLSTLVDTNCGNKFPCFSACHLSTL
jgi:hypothetical protein